MQRIDVVMGYVEGTEVIGTAINKNWGYAPSDSPWLLDELRDLAQNDRAMLVWDEDPRHYPEFDGLYDPETLIRIYDGWVEMDELGEYMWDMECRLNTDPTCNKWEVFGDRFDGFKVVHQDWDESKNRGVPKFVGTKEECLRWIRLEDQTKLRRRVEEALRKDCDFDQLSEIAQRLGVKD